MTDLPAWLILLPLLWGTLSFLLPPERRATLACSALALQLAMALLLASQLMQHGTQLHAVGGWEPPLGIVLRADGLSAVMLLLAQAVALPVALHARIWFAQHRQGNAYFWPLAGYLSGAMNALFLSADVFNLYVTLELLSLASVCLVASGGEARSMAAALRYLFASLLGSGAYLLGVALLYGGYGTVSLPQLAMLLAADPSFAAVMCAGLMMAGLALKTALFPLHFWLPPAHGGAAPPVSALLSALVIKASFYLAVRLWLELFEPLTIPAAAQLLGLLGAAAIVWGSLRALRQKRLKLLIAWSTVAQVGYLFLLFPLTAGTTDYAAQSALQGTVLQAVAHGLAKAAMFVAAGAIIMSVGHDDIDHLGGVARHLPLTLFTIALSGVTLMGLPPSIGFLAKWLLIDAAIGSGQWHWIAVLVAGGLLTAAYLFRILRHAFVRSDQSRQFKDLPALQEWPALLLAIASLLLGVQGGRLLALLEVA